MLNDKYLTEHVTFDRFYFSKDMNKSREFSNCLHQVLQQNAHGYATLVTGSVAELPFQYITENFSDFDLMRLLPHHIAVLSTEEIPVDFRGTAYIIETTDVHPGFARLRFAVPTRCSEYDRQLVGTPFQTTDEFIKKDWPINGPANTTSIFTSEQIKEIFMDSNDHSLKIRDFQGLETDMVSSIPCKSWPGEIAEWVTRKRHQLWPSHIDIDRIVSEGCHLVTKPHLSNRSDKTVFRFSFSPAEITLIHTWSPVQKYIYHILRLIKSKIVKQCSANGRKSPLCTYYFKTLMLWACENRSSEFWDESRIAKSVGELLCEMIEWLIEKKCPNYFISDNNMMDHFPDNENFEEEILMLLNLIESSISECLAGWPMVSRNNRLRVKLTRKLLSIGQMAFTRQIPFINRWRIQSAKKHFHKSSASINFVYAELAELYSAIEAHLQLTNSGQSALNNCIDCVEYRQALEHFEKATTNDDASCREIHHLFTLEDNLEDNCEKILFKQSEEDSSLESFISKCIKTDTRKQCEDDSNRQSQYLDNWKRGINVTSHNTVENKLMFVPQNEVSSSYFVEHILFHMLDKLLPKVSYFIGVAYRANFYYAFLHDYSRALRLCEEAIQCMEGLDKIMTVSPAYDSCCNVVLSSKFMPLFDNYIQTVFGFFLLQVKILETMTIDVQSQTKWFPGGNMRPFVVVLSPIQFILYLKMRCLNGNDVNAFSCKILKAATLISLEAQAWQ